MRETRITENSWVPLGRAIAVAIGLFAGGYCVAQALGRMEARLASLESTRWTLADMQRWTAQLERTNRDIRLYVPDPENLKPPQREQPNRPQS